MRKLFLAAAAAVSFPWSICSAQAAETGLYAGPGCYGLTHLSRFDAWLGEPVHHVTENLDQSSWSNLVSDAEWSIGCYAKVRSTTSFTFSIPMLTEDGASTLAKGAAGEYDQYFTQIAKILVAHDLSTSIIRIGWEFNGNWQPWSSHKDNVHFMSYYRRIVSLMRAVPGARFQFEWCPNVGTGSLAPDQSYPGDDFVDIVGMDVYDGHYSAIDAAADSRWNYFVTRDYGLQWQVDFANAHGKRFSLPEWACCGASTGDDPYFINQMARWLRNNGYLYADYWDSNTVYRGELSNGQYPMAAAAYLADFGAR
ncbi:glycoside hydrolase family 26 protein [Aliidongia dinghuensis]|uniref:glycoside hydrolase family 26 protein n=1 Tax=Aliidongia dinghuensis TaxID=1867774 RepID=UPI00166E6553|nr:glycosyl hydrolase [Aliidongia dinghuensis]